MCVCVVPQNNSTVSTSEATQSACVFVFAELDDLHHKSFAVTAGAQYYKTLVLPSENSCQLWLSVYDGRIAVSDSCMPVFDSWMAAFNSSIAVFNS